MAITGISELTLQARDLEALAEFYTRGFGLVEIDRKSDRIWLGIGDRARLGLWTPGAKELGDKGGAGGDRSLYARDPEGNVVEAWDFFELGRTVRALQQAA